MANDRILRLNALLQEEISKILLREVEFPDKVFVTVTRVEISKNLVSAKVFVSTIPEASAPKVSKVLDRRLSDIQEMVMKRLSIRPVPQIRFVKEEETKKAAEVEEILANIKSASRRKKG